MCVGRRQAHEWPERRPTKVSRRVLVVWPDWYHPGSLPRISVRCDPLPVDVNPIWNPPPGVSGRRFVEPPREADDANAKGGGT